MYLDLFFWIGIIVLFVLIGNFLTRNFKGCSGNCQQGKFPCDCGKFD